MAVSYHVHSRWSDGKNTIPELIAAARDIGLDELGLSDHYCLTPDRKQMHWCMPIDKLDDYVADVQESAGEAGEDVLIRLGLEVDFVPETLGEMKEILASQPFDYVIGSVHLVDGFLIDDTPELWDPLSQDDRNEVIRTYWIRVRQMAECGLFDFAGHLDLWKKFNIYPTIDLSEEISAALDAIAAVKLPIELNTSGWFKPCAEQYPSKEILQGCFDRKIPMVVSADAHFTEHLTRAFDRAYRILREVGYTELSSFGGRMRYPYPMPEVE
jgi:histidinol-phosphatase (PHP family)